MNRAAKTVVWVVGSLCLFVGYWYWQMLGLGNAREIYVVPHDFRGVVYILFNQDNGTLTEREGLKRVYRVPRSGVLRTQFSFQEGMNSLPEFFWDSAGQRRPLRYQMPNGRHIPHGAYVSTIESGSGGCAVDAQGNDKERVKYKSFIVSEEQSVEKFYQQLSDDAKTPPELVCDVTLTDEDSVRRF